MTRFFRKTNHLSIIIFHCGSIVVNKISVVVKSKSEQQTDQHSIFSIRTRTNCTIPSPNQIEKEMNHLFFKLIELDSADKEELTFMSFLNDLSSKYGIDSIALLSHEDLLSIGANLPLFLALEVKSIQLYLRQLQKQVFTQPMIVSTNRPSMILSSESS